MRARRWVSVAVAVGAAVILSAGAAGAQSADDDSDGPRTITVQGTGVVQGTPDVLDLTIGVDTRASTAAEALRRNSTLTRNVIDVLRDAGVEREDIQTGNFSMQPQFGEDGIEVTGYAVSNVVTATIRDLEETGAIIDAATSVAGDEIVVKGVSFSIDDNTELIESAREDAVKRAQTAARQLARAAGVELDEMLSLTEDSAPIGPIADAEALRLSSDVASTPIEPGSQTLTVLVTLVFKIS